MTLHGHVQNGLIVLNENVALPEGAAVEVQIVTRTPVIDTEKELPTLAETLNDFVGVLKDLPPDASINHDHYLYGTAKTE